jgi:hypothetical protein
MFKVVSASPDGDVVLWRTQTQAPTSALAPTAPVLNAWGKLDEPKLRRRAWQTEVNESTPDTLCESLGFHIVQRRPIQNGEILFVKKGKPSKYLVLKYQQPADHAVDATATPGPSVCEIKALLVLHRLMAQRRVAPVFCELWNPSVPTVHAVMRAYVTDLSDWVRGNGRDPGRTCRAKPAYPAPADPSEMWIYTRCAGNALARSPYPSDVKLFNTILRQTLLQVLVGFAQAQRHCLMTHNDLHCGNVMFDHCASGVSRLFVTGAGCFLLPKRAARVRVIDFQHACFMDGNVRVAGIKDDVHNAFSLTYDVWRFCSSLMWEVLRPYYDVVEEDLLALLYRGAHDEPGAVAPKWDAEVHWKPYFLAGPTAEELLGDPAFDRYRCSSDTCADEIYFERTPDPVSQERYLRTLVFQHRGPLPIPRALAYAAFDRPRPAASAEARALLSVWTKNYEGTVMGRVAMYHKHTPAARARFLFMELCLLRTTLDHLWGPLCAHEVELRSGDAARMCALADGIGAVVHAEYAYIARPPFMDDYNSLVLEAARLPCVKAVLSVMPSGSGLSADEEEHLLNIQRDGEVERWRGVFTRLSTT